MSACWTAIARIALLVVALGLAVACAAPAPPASSPAKPAAPAAAPAQPSGGAPPAAQPPAGAAAPRPVSSEVIRIGHLGGGTDSGILLADGLGFFQEQGLTLELIQVRNVNEGLPLLATNQLQVLGAAPAAPVYNAMARGLNLKIVADRSQVFPGRSIAPLVARKEHEGRINGPADLFGKRIAVAGEGATSWVDIHRWVSEAGLDFTGLDIITMGFPDMVPALGGGQVDVIAVVEPFVTLAETRGIGFLAVEEFDMYPNHQTGVLMYGSDFIAQREEEARRLAVAYLKGVRAYLDAFSPAATNRAAVVRVLTEQTAVKDPALYDRMTPVGFDPNGRPNVDSLRYNLDFFGTAGYVQNPPSVEQVLDLRFIDHAVSVLGRR